MAWTAAIHHRGVCGNFRFKFYNITDAATTKSVVKTDMHQVQFISSTNTTDSADNFKARTLNWTGTADSDVANDLVDSSETFVAEIDGLQVFADSGANDGDSAILNFKSGDTTALDLVDPADATDEDLFPAGTETYLIKNERYVELTPVTANDDGTLLVIGK